MAFCTYCGTRLPSEEARFCPTCGTAVTPPPAPPAVEPPTEPMMILESPSEPSATFDTPPEPEVPVSSPAEPSVVSPPMPPTPPAWFTDEPATPSRSGFAVAGLVLGIVSLVGFWLSFFILPLLIPAGIFALIGFFRSPVGKRAVAIAAVIVCAAALLLVTLMTTFYIVAPEDLFEDELYEYEEPFYDEAPFYDDPYEDFFDDFFGGDPFFGYDNSYQSSL